MKRMNGLDFTDPSADPIGQFRNSGFVEKIHPSDNMNRPGAEQTYFWMGRTALDCIRAVAPDRDFREVLDFPSGYGRVLRFLRAAYPNARIVACEIDPGGVAFCEQEFGAEPVVSKESIDQVTIEGDFDLIWVGSLFTHLDESSADALFALLASKLKHDGLLVFSIAGRFVAELAKSGEHGGVPAETIASMMLDFEQNAFAFGSYKPGIVGEANYGRAFIDLPWLERKRNELGLQIDAYIDRGYSRRQDVVVWRKP